MDNKGFVAAAVQHIVDAHCIGFHSPQVDYSIDCADGRYIAVHCRHCCTYYNCVMVGQLASVGSNCLKIFKGSIGN